MKKFRSVLNKRLILKAVCLSVLGWRLNQLLYKLYMVSFFFPLLPFLISRECTIILTAIRQDDTQKIQKYVVVS